MKNTVLIDFSHLFKIIATIKFTTFQDYSRYKPTDNAIAERMNGILKVEWIYHQELFASYRDAEQGIAGMIHFYNHIRPHMSIGMKTPMEVYLGGEPGKMTFPEKSWQIRED